MPRQHRCPRCKTLLTLDDKLRLQNVKCPHCPCIFVPADEEYRRNRDEVARMSQLFKRLLWGVFFTPPLVFTYLTFQGISFVEVGKQLDFHLLLKFSIALFYLSWSLATPWDTSGMQATYAIPPNRGRIPVEVLAAMVVLLGGAAILCLVQSVQLFAAFLGVFWLANIVAWIGLCRKLEPTVNDSIERYRELKKYEKLESLLEFDDMHRGRWQWWRWGVGAVLLAIINQMASTPLAAYIGRRLGGLSVDVVLALSVLSFILLIEGWIWYRRLQADHVHRLLMKLSEQYDMTPKEPMSLLPIPSAAPIVANPAAAIAEPVVAGTPASVVSGSPNPVVAGSPDPATSADRRSPECK